MPAMVDEILAKAGYVRLSKYGLMLTPQGHIISLQPRLPDEGSSARIVGWLEGCEPNGAIQLPDQFVAPPRPPAPAVASPVATPRPSAPPPVPAKAKAKAKATTPALPGVSPVSQEDEDALWEAALSRAKAASETVAAPVLPPPPPVWAPVASPKLAVVASVDLEAGDDAEDDGDEWEWQLALARARAAAEEAEAAKAAPAPAPKPAPAPVAATPAPAVIPAKPAPAPVAVAPTHAAPARAPARAPAPRAERSSMQPRPMRASNTTGWKPPTPPTRAHANDQTSPKPKLPLVAEPTGTDVKRLARGTEAPAAITEKPVAAASKATPSTPRLTLVAAEPRPLPPPVDDDSTHVDLVRVKAASAARNDGSHTPSPSPLPRLSVRR